MSATTPPTPPTAAPTLADLITAEAVLRAIVEGEPARADTAFHALVALDLRQRIREAQAIEVARIRGQQWAAEQKRRLRR